MFGEACSRIRNAVYGVIGSSQIKKNEINCTNGTAFMIASGTLVTAAHLVHIKNDPKKSIHTLFETIRAPDVGQRMEIAKLIAEDAVRDIALLRIENPRSNDYVILEPNIVPIGTSCGSLGFPLAKVTFLPTGKRFDLIERFQGANISAFHTQVDPSGRALSYYETDSLMYGGSSGCPAFLTNANVIGMQVKTVVEKSNKSIGGPSRGQVGAETLLAISIKVPSMDIIAFTRNNGIAI